MASIARGDVEILVHTTAPSRGQDDARYRALADAYLQFQPSKKKRLDQRAQDVETNEAQVGSQLQEKVAQSTQEERESKASYRPDGDDDCLSQGPILPLESQDLEVLRESQLLESPDLSFDSVANNANSPVFRQIVTCIGNEGGQQQTTQQQSSQHSNISWVAPGSTVSDSQPELPPTIQPAASPTSILEQYLQSMKKATASYEASKDQIEHHMEGPQEKVALPETSDIEISSATNQVLNDLCTPVVVYHSSSEQRTEPVEPVRGHNHDTISSQYLTSGRLDRNDLSIVADSIGTSSSVPSKLASSSFQCTEEEAHHTKRQRIEPAASSTALISSEASNRSTIAATLTPNLVDWTSKDVINPSSPQVGYLELKPGMLITPTLQNFINKESLAALYKPVVQMRELRPMERGYWLIDWSNWSEDLRLRAWNYLGKVIGGDLAGWGVWAEKKEGPGTFRVFCWGTIVPHIYLLIFVASESKVKKSSATWMGGDNKPVITMQD